MLSVNITCIAIITVKNVDYRCIVYNISKSGAINFLKNSLLEVYSKHFFNFFRLVLTSLSLELLLLEQ